MLLTTGERVSAALLTMALADLGVAAVSFTGSQVGIITDTVHGKAKILEVKGDRVRDALAAGKVAVVAGFQGVSTDKEITTMGRGASDLTASALAKALGADACEIYTDVTGVFSADPRIVPRARKLDRVSFDEMLEMAGAGSKVLALRSVEFARNHGVALHVRSAFTWEPGTWVTDEPDDERQPQGGLRWKTRSSPVSSPTRASRRSPCSASPTGPGISATLFEPLAAASVNVDMIVQNTSTEGKTDISFTMPSADMGVAEDIVSRVAAEIGAEGVTHDSDIAKVSVVGAGHEVVAGHRRQDVPHARRRGRQHRDDLDVDDPHLGRHRQRRPRAGGPLPAHRVRPRHRRRLRRAAPRAPLTRRVLYTRRRRAPTHRGTGSRA